MEARTTISYMGTPWKAWTLATLDGYYTELSDHENVLATLPTEVETEPSTLIATLSKGNHEQSLIQGCSFLCLTRWFGFGHSKN